MRRSISSPTKFKSNCANELVFDMRRTSLLVEQGITISPAYSGLTVITFPSIFKIARSSGNNHPHVSDAAANANSSEPYRIMIVDDERDITLVFKSALEHAGFKVDVFNNPLDALSHFKSDYYDLALLDIRMPQMSGFELYQEIVKKDARIKACFISAFEVLREELKKYAPEKDEECVIRKPVSTRDLVRIIKEELE